MPSCTVPTCSNSSAISHITQCEMPFRRSAIAVAAATAPTPTRPCVHSHSVSPAVPRISAMLSTWLTSSTPVTRRNCVYAVPMNSCIAPRACTASRRVCENSLTVAMLVYASVMRPVISERASACACATRPSRGTNHVSAATYSTSQPQNGSSNSRSKPPASSTMVTK